MPVLAVPNWSFGRNRDLMHQFREILDSEPVLFHYCEGDPDHNRTVTAFSGDMKAVGTTFFRLAEVALSSIDLNRHTGVHPRIGALDVCPFVSLGEANEEVLDWAESMGSELAMTYDLPIFLYEKSESGRHESDLPSLRKGGFGALLGKQLRPDFGPNHAHPRLGVTVLGVRDFLVALNVNIDSENLDLAKAIAKDIRILRASGDTRFLGVRALGLPLDSQKRVQVSMNLTLPDITPIDPIVEWIRARVTQRAETELIGVIHERHLEQATSLKIRERQIVRDPTVIDADDPYLSS